MGTVVSSSKLAKAPGLKASTCTRGYFAFGVFVGIAWSFVAAFAIGVLPIPVLWEVSWGFIMVACYFTFGRQVPQKTSGDASTAEPHGIVTALRPLQLMGSAVDDTVPDLRPPLRYERIG